MTQWLMILTLLLPCVPSAHAVRTFWADPVNGSDSNGCTNTTTPQTTGAKRTFQAVLNCITQADDHVKLRAGTFTPSSTPQFPAVNAGSWSTPLIVENHNNETVIIAGSSRTRLNMGSGNIGFVIIRGLIFDGTGGSNILVNAGYTTLTVSGAEQLVTFGCSGGACAHDIVYENNIFRNSAYSAANMNNPSLTRLTFRNNEVYNIGKVQNCPTFYIGSSGSIFEDNYVHDTACAAFAPFCQTCPSGSGANNLIIRRNRIERTGYFYAPTPENGGLRCCVPPASGGSGSCDGVGEPAGEPSIGMTCSSRIPQGSRQGSMGIQISSGDNIQVYNNVISDGGGGIVTDRAAPNCKIYNNTIHAFDSGVTGSGQLLSGYNPNQPVGIFLECFGSSCLTGANNCAIRNNLIYQPGYANQIQNNAPTAKNIFSHNMCSFADGDGCDPALVTDPHFVDPAVKNYQLQAGSPAIDAGVSLSLVSTDILGITRPQGLAYDLGAYEFSGRANTYTITRNLATVAARADITASWTVTPGSGQPFDWIGLVIAGDAPENYIATDGEGNTAWTYTNAVDTGTFTIAAPLIAGTYEFLYCVNDGFACPARSPTFTVTTSSANTYTITRNLATVAARADITASWMVTPGPGQPLDWIGLVIAGDAPENFIATDGEGNTAWTYTNAVDTGTFTIAAPLIAGTYEFLYCVNNGFACPARSPTFTVTTSSGHIWPRPPGSSSVVVVLKSAVSHPGEVACFATAIR